MNTLVDDAKQHGTAVGLQVDRITINGGKPLRGRIELKGAKNLVTKAMVAAILGDTPSVLKDVPNISDVQIVRKEEGADPAAVAFEALEAALVLGYDVVLLDTAGRLHTQKQLMEELKKIQRVLARKVEGAPHEVWLVLDATNGQNAIQQARIFTEAVKVTGLVVAKLDGTARAGALFQIQRELGIPVRYVGTGETKEELEPFEAEPFVDAIVGA